MSLLVWKNADELNKRLFESLPAKQPQYVLLLTKTTSFNVQEDIQKLLNIPNKQFFWILRRFQTLRVKTEYATVGTWREKTVWGPITNEVSENICFLKFHKLYFSSKNDIIFIGPDYLKKKFPSHVKLISVESFVSNILLGP